MKTLMPKQVASIERKWFVVDAEGKTLGRLATQIALILKGKNRADYAGHVDNGDYVIVLNAGKVVVTGNKMTDKLYRTHSGFMGGLKEVPFAKMQEKKPTEMLRLAVSGMLPKNRLRDDMLLRLKLEVGDTHGFAAQKPVAIEL